MPIISALFNNTFSIYRPARAADGQGGWDITYTLMGTLEGRLSPSEGFSKEIAQSEEVHFTHRLYTNADEDIRKSDLVLIDTLTLEVLMIKEPSLADHHLEIDLRERQEEGALIV